MACVTRGVAGGVTDGSMRGVTDSVTDSHRQMIFSRSNQYSLSWYRGNALRNMLMAIGQIGWWRHVRADACEAMGEGTQRLVGECM